MKFIFILLTVLVSFNVNSQQHWEDLRDQGANFYNVQAAFELEWENKEYERGNGYTLYKRWEYYMEPRSFPDGNTNITKEYVKAWEKRKSKSGANKSAGGWEPIGYTEWNTQSYNPGNGRVNVAAKDPSIQGRYYAGTPSGGLWRTNDDFNTWEPLTDDFPTLGISAILIHPTNSDVIYIGTGDGDGSDTYSNGVLKSIDGGSSWQTTGLSYNLSTEYLIHKLIMHPDNPETLFAATKQGLWKTTSGGEVWYQVQSGNIRDVEFKPGNPQIIYCCTGRIYKSINGGEDFDAAGEGMPGVTNVERMALGVSLDEPDYVYALCVNDNDNGLLGVYRSEDSADSFSLRADSPNILSYPIDGEGEGGQGYYDLALDVNPTNAENIFTGGVNVWRSLNGGTDYIINAHWFYEPGMQFNYVHADIHNIQYLDGELFVCSDGGIFRSQDGGVSFEDVSAGLQISQFYRFGGYETDPGLIIGGTQDNGTILLSNNSWTHVLGADGMEAAIHPLNPDIMYCASQNGGVRSSVDGGDSFSYIAGGIDGDAAWVTPYVLHPEETGTILMGYDEIWKSTNNGGDFIQTSDFGAASSLRAISNCGSNPDVIYAITNTRLHKSIDAGDSWELVATGISQYSMTYVYVNPANEDDVVITFSGFGAGEKVYHSIDGGANWENISFNLPNIPANCASIDEEDGSIYIGTDLGIYYWNPALVNWIPFNDGLPNVIVNELEINNEFDIITAATYGRGIWRSNQFSGVTEEPEALFESNERIICEGDSILFSDLSYGHEPGWEWSLEGSDEVISSEQNPWIHYNAAGSYAVSLAVQNEIGSDTYTRTNYIIVQSAQESFPYSESFSGSETLSDFEFISEPEEGIINWIINGDVGHNDPGALWINNGNLDEPFTAEVFSKQFNLADLDTAYLSFWYAYAQKHPETDDRLRLYTSNSCGRSWVQREMFRGEGDLNTVGSSQLSEFIPSDDSQWMYYSYPLASSDFSENFSFKFRFTNDNGNHIYIDEINITSIDLGLTENTEQNTSLAVFPNPSSDVIIIQSDLNQEIRRFRLIDNQGRESLNKRLTVPVGRASSQLDIREVSSGVYYLQIIGENEERIDVRKILKN
jgi:PKD repeat protein